MQLIVGVKGTGKTKAIIEEVNKASKETKGVVICIEYGRKLNYDISTRARLVDAQEYAIDSAAKLYGFVSGMIAGNYDITELYIDSALKICGDDIAAFEECVVGIETLCENYKIDCVMSVSAEPSALSEKTSAYIRK